MKDKTLLITVFHSFISKNFLNTEAFSLLRSSPGLKIILIVPKNKESFFIEQYSDSNITIVGFDFGNILRRKMVQILSALSHLLLSSHYLWYKKVERRGKSTHPLRLVKYYFEVAFTSIFFGKKYAHSVLRFLFKKMLVVPEIEVLFDRYAPDIVFSTDVFDEMDVLVNREARVRDVHIIGMVRSWDNCYSKGVLRVIPDTLLVNNEEIKKEATTLHDIHAEKIHVVGLPQYDQFVNGIRTKRQEFFNEIGADQNKKLILFSPAGSVLSDIDWQLCTILKRLIDTHKIDEPVTFLIRNHPHHPADLSLFKSDSNFIIENPGMSFGLNGKEVELTKRDSQHLADSLYYSDIVMYVATTLGNDSLLFDKPQIIINFDGWENKEYTRSTKRYHNEDHMKKMIACGGVSVVTDEHELATAINTYLQTPEYLKEGRLRARAQQVYYTDGKSSDRIANRLIEELKKV